MAIVDTHPEPIAGPWTAGFVLDKHVVASVPIGYIGDHLQFDTTRTPLGELVYQLKNKGGRPDDIIDTAVAFVSAKWSSRLDDVVCPPPSLRRPNQPAVVLAAGIAAALGLAAPTDVVAKAKLTPQMKNLPSHERAAALADAIQAGPTPVNGRRVLIVDDLWETGSTMRRVAEVLRAMGAAEIRALAMTRTK